MIQRIQSVFLLLAIVLLAALLTIGFPFESRAATAFPWFAAAVSLLAGAAVVAAGLALFQYRNRRAQQRTALIGFALADTLGVVQVIAYVLSGDFDALPTVGWIAVALPIVAGVLLFLARTYIARDEALVRSMDRLR